MKKSVFWGSLGTILYVYLIFPILVVIRGRLFQRPVAKADITPRVSLIIAAYNEQESIGERIENALAMDYPADKLEIIIASDGSSDNTNTIIASYDDSRLRFLDLPRQGKIGALNTAVQQATGEVFVFSDATSMLAPDALQLLVRSFADPSVGSVGGNQYYKVGGAAAGAGERSYWGFDRMLKRYESLGGSMIAAGGAMHAVRRELYRPLPPGVGDDFVISTRPIEQGYRLVFEPEAIVYETIASNDQAEFRRKVRVIDQGLRGLWAVRSLFNPFRYGFYALQIFSHKLLRWSVIWPMITLMLSSLSLFRCSWIYRWATYGQAALYSAATLGMILRGTSLARMKLFKLFAIPYYFCLVNVACLKAWFQMLKNKPLNMWN